MKRLFLRPHLCIHFLMLTVLVMMAAPGLGQEAKKLPPKLTKVVLSQKGQGYFEHQWATETSKPSFDLTFNVADANTILQTVQDPDKNLLVTAVSADAKSSKLPFNLGQNTSAYDLLSKALGAKLVVTTRKAADFKGVLVSVEAITDAKSGKSTVLTVLGAEGKLLSFALENVQQLQFLAPHHELGEALYRAQGSDLRTLHFEVVDPKKSFSFSYLLTVPSLVWTVNYRLDRSGDGVVPQMQVLLENPTFLDWEQVELTLTAGPLSAASPATVNDKDRFATLTKFSLARQRSTAFAVSKDKGQADLTLNCQPHWVYRPADNPDNVLLSLDIKETNNKSLPTGTLQLVDGDQPVNATPVPVPAADPKKPPAFADPRIKAKKTDPVVTTSRVLRIGDGNIASVQKRQTKVTLTPSKKIGMGRVSIELPTTAGWKAAPGAPSVKDAIYQSDPIGVDEGKPVSWYLLEYSDLNRLDSLISLSSQDKLDEFKDFDATYEIKQAVQDLVDKKAILNKQSAIITAQQKPLQDTIQTILNRQPSGRTDKFYDQNKDTLLADDAAVRKLFGKLDELSKQQNDLNHSFEQFILAQNKSAPKNWLQGGFIQYQQWMFDGAEQGNMALSQDDWVDVLKNMKLLQMDTVVLQYMGYDAVSYVGGECPGVLDPTEILLSHADKLKMKIYLGLYFKSTWETDDKKFDPGSTTLDDLLKRVQLRSLQRKPLSYTGKIVFS